jgi:hypothetical protein
MLLRAPHAAELGQGQELEAFAFDSKNPVTVIMNNCNFVCAAFEAENLKPLLLMLFITLQREYDSRAHERPRQT